MKNSLLLLFIYLIINILIINSFIIKSFHKFNKLSTSVDLSTKLSSVSSADDITPKQVTKDIMLFFSNQTNYYNSNKLSSFSKKLQNPTFISNIDGIHILTLLFQSARYKIKANLVLPIDIMVKKLKAWDREWTERDISTFVYGIRSLDCMLPIESELIKLGANKISSSSYSLQSSRAIGNALYGLQDITSDTGGVKELCLALADKIVQFRGDLTGQDIGIGIYGLQGMSADLPEVRKLISTLATKIRESEAEFDQQALSNALYGLQSMSSDYPEVLSLISALATKIGESRVQLCAQAIGSSLYGLQKLDSDSLEVRTLVATLAEKIETSTASLDAQAIGNALFGLQRMKSNSPEVRALLQAVANKLTSIEVQLDSKAIGSALYGLNNMNSDSIQVRSLLQALANRISTSQVYLSGQAIADSLYGLRGMKDDCKELRSLLSALGDRIDAASGKLDSQEIGNSLFGLQALSSEMEEVRIIISKLASKVKRSRAYLRPQQIGRALLGFQRLSSSSLEVRSLITQLTKRIVESDRTPLTSTAIADSLYGLQGMTSDIPEVQELVAALAIKISSTAAVLSPDLIGRALFGLQGLSSSKSIFEESALGLDSDEVQFLISVLWDKIKVNREPMSLTSIAMGLQGMIQLQDPISTNIKQYLYSQLLQLYPNVNSTENLNNEKATSPLDVIIAMRALLLNKLPIPVQLEEIYNKIEDTHRKAPIFQLSRQDRLIIQKYISTHGTKSYSENDNVLTNVLFGGFRIDMLIEDLKLVIELDGPTHKYPARGRFDKIRDEYLSKSFGFKVKRIQIFGLSTDEVVKLIDQIIFEEREKQELEKIQKIYSSETELQKLYFPKNR